MTDTRKQIIELIEPYMSKDFNTWLYYRKTNWDIEIVWDVWLFNHKLENKNNWKLVTNHWLWVKSLDDMKEWGYQIIWHYYTTAVLRCIWKQKILWHYDYDEWYFEFFNDNWTLFCKIKDIPLHLYTEQEDKDLLESLKNLWPTNK